MTVNPYGSPSTLTSGSRSRPHASRGGSRTVFLVAAITCFGVGAILPGFQASGPGYSPTLGAVLKVVYPLDSAPVTPPALYPFREPGEAGKCGYIDAQGAHWASAVQMPDNHYESPNFNRLYQTSGASDELHPPRSPEARTGTAPLRC